MAEDYSEEIIGAAIEVHRNLGPGLLESAYEQCLARELALRDISFRTQVPVPVPYKGVMLDCAYRLDFLVGNATIVEVKAVDKLVPLHEAQLITYLKLSKLSVGLLLNFNVPFMKEGIKRMVLNFDD